MFDMEPFGDKRVPGTDIGLAKGLRQQGPDGVIPRILAVHLTSFWLTIGHPGHQDMTFGGHKDIWTGLEDRNDI